MLHVYYMSILYNYILYSIQYTSILYNYISILYYIVYKYIIYSQSSICDNTVGCSTDCSFYFPTFCTLVTPTVSLYNVYTNSVTVQCIHQQCHCTMYTQQCRCTMYTPTVSLYNVYTNSVAVQCIHQCSSISHSPFIWRICYTHGQSHQYHFVIL